MTVREIYEGSDGDATKTLYARLDTFGPIGFIAKNLFRACKASERAKLYSRKFKGDAYQKKQWSLGLLCDALAVHGPTAGIRFGWKNDPATVGYPWILYVDLPTGQVSFHSPTRGIGPDYLFAWDGARTSRNRIIDWTEVVLGERPAPPPTAFREVIDEVATVTEEDYETLLFKWKQKNGLA